MIEPGQKLRDGDFVRGINQRQARELLRMDGHSYSRNYPKRMERFGAMYLSSEHKVFAIEIVPLVKTEYPFPDFKQLCINTFGG